MKIKRNELKNILKECIKELIDEGAFNSVVRESLSSQVRPSVNDMVATKSVDRYNTVGSMTPNERLRAVTKLAAAEAAGGDKKRMTMMENIFADTATTTLQNQLSQELHEGNSAELVQIPQNISDKDKTTLESLASERGMGHWAALAFGTYDKK